jgi:RND family efflux transporter MFP subunit
MPTPFRTHTFFLVAFLGIIPNILAAQGLSYFEVQKTEIGQERLFDGVVEAINQSTVSAQTGGRIIEINFDIDDAVKKDDILIKISDSEQSAGATQAAGAVSRARAQLTLAKNNFERFEKLYTSQTISKSQLDDARSALDSANASLRTARAARDNAQKQVDYTVVRAPYSGIVTDRSVELGETVTPGQPLMSGLSLTQLRVRTDVPNRFAQKIITQQGVDIVFDTSPPTRVHSADLTVFPFANIQSNSVTIRVGIPDNTANVYPGMLSKIAFQTDRTSRIAIPESAVINRSEIIGVYVLDEDNIYLRRISVGNPYTAEDQVIMIEVLSGLKVGERVANDPIAAVKQLIAQKPAAQPAH